MVNVIYYSIPIIVSNKKEASVQEFVLTPFERATVARQF